MNKYIILTVALLMYAVGCRPQKLAMGEWRTHSSYTSIEKIAEAGHKVFGISSGALFSIYKDDNTVETYSKLFGLSDSQVHIIEYSEENRTLVIVYDNSNIDLLTDDDEIYNIPGLYQKTLSVSKVVNSISFSGNMAYLATDFGVVVINLQKREVLDTYMIGYNGAAEKVLDAFVKGRYIYALMADRILYADAYEANLLNYQNWNTLPLPASANAQNVQLIDAGENICLVQADGVMYRYNHASGWSVSCTGVQSVEYDDGVLFVRDNTSKVTIEGNLSVAFDLYALNVEYDKSRGIVWYSTSDAVMKYDVNTETFSAFTPNGPESNTIWVIYSNHNRIYTVPGGRSASGAVQLSFPGSVSIYENGRWRSIKNSELTPTSPIGRCLDFVSMAFDPEDPDHYWVASFGNGLFEFRNDKLVQQYTYENSDIESYYQNDNSETYETKHLYIRVDALTYDAHGNLWMYNFSSTGNQLKFIDRSGEFHMICYPALQGLETLQEIVMNNDNPNQKLALFPRYKAPESKDSYLFVFDDGGTPADISDDRTIGLTQIYDQDGGRILFSSKLLRSIAQDKNGIVWVGTTAGIFLLTDLDQIYDDDYRCSRIKIPRNDGSGLADYLLETESILDIAVDGANRKWIATATSGVYLVSEDGLETIHHFTTTNSPLLSDNVRAIGINDGTGEVFFSTAAGLISFQSDAVAAGNHFQNVHAYPNPVRPEYTGLITITGLTENTSVRITDVNGNMIYETRSNGGVATWDGCRLGGHRVATGVYFAHCVSEDRKEKVITKILVVN